ncbi:MAG: AAA family ATPase [Gammaproteobacteria bacterium]
MAENVSYKGRSSNMSGKSAETAVSAALITTERSQKLDLLRHLITNLRQSLIVCGPAGIGKTTLLKILTEHAPPNWCCLFLVADQQLSFEKILQDLTISLANNKFEITGQGINRALEVMSQHQRKVVLIIDDAGSLVPGLIDALNRFSLGHSSLRIVFLLTQDELFVKSSSDRTIDDCHFIELPPLSEKQCGEFIRNLSGKPDMPVSFGSINDELIERLYRETHGIPGRIMEALPLLSEFRKSPLFNWSPVVWIVSITLIGIAYLIRNTEPPDQSNLPVTLSSSERVKKSVDISPRKLEMEGWTADTYSKSEMNVPTSVLPVDSSFDSSSLHEIKQSSDTLVTGKVSSPSASALALDKMQNVTTANDLAEAEIRSPKTAKNIPESLAPVVVEASVEVGKPGQKIDENLTPEENKPEKKVDSGIEKDDKAWVLKQAANKYTLQLIALSNLESMRALIKKHVELQSGLKFIEMDINGKKKYILLYGAYGAYSEAGRAMLELPKEFRKSWIRRFQVLQNELIVSH